MIKEIENLIKILATNDILIALNEAHLKGDIIPDNVYEIINNIKTNLINNK